MRDYFNNLPLILYGNNVMRDLTRRVAFANTALSSPYAFYPYQLKEGQRADQVAGAYYNDKFADWLVYLANDVVDPYYDWYRTEDEFNDFIIAKYGFIERAMSLVAYYQVNWSADERALSPSEYDALPAVEKKYWTPHSSDAEGSVIAYYRKQVDWIQLTNKTVICYYDSKPDIASNTVVSFSVDGETFGTGVLGGLSATAAEVVKVADVNDRLVKFDLANVTGTFVENESITLKNSARPIKGYSTPTVYRANSSSIVCYYSSSVPPDLTRLSGQVSGATANVTASHVMNLVGETGASTELTGSEVLTFTNFDGVQQDTGIPDDELAYWSSVSYYEYERELNSKRGTIRLLDNRLATTVNKQLKEIMSEE